MTTRRRPHAPDDGTVTTVVVIFTLAILFVSGLVLDGGRSLAAHERATNEAEAAARVGAQAVDEIAYQTTGQLTIDARRARTLVGDYLATRRLVGRVLTINGNSIDVEVSVATTYLLLGSRRVVATEHAVALVGRI